MSTRPYPERPGAMELATRRCPRLRVVWDLRELNHKQKPRRCRLPAGLGPATVTPTSYGKSQKVNPLLDIAYRYITYRKGRTIRTTRDRPGRRRVARYLAIGTVGTAETVRRGSPKSKLGGKSRYQDRRAAAVPKQSPPASTPKTGPSGSPEAPSSEYACGTSRPTSLSSAPPLGASRKNSVVRESSSQRRARRIPARGPNLQISAPVLVALQAEKHLIYVYSKGR